MDMRIKISKERFQALTGNELGWELIQPSILQARGQDLEQKRKVYEWLTPGQKSLFSFWILYGHTRSGWLQFFLGGSYLGGYVQLLPVIRKDLRQVNAQALLEHLEVAEKLYAENEEMVKLIEEAQEKGADQRPERQAEIEKFKHELETIDRRLFVLLDETNEQIEKYIRAKPEEFVLFTN